MHPARELWQCYEPLHATCYFHPAFREDMAERGLQGGWNVYFAGRSAPLGVVPPGVVTALFFGFAPLRVERALPSSWEQVAPMDAITSRLVTASRVLEPAAATVEPAALTAALQALETAVDVATYDGRALGAAWAGVPRPDDELARLWLATAALREHRGDGHVLACVHAGLTGLTAGITHVAAGRVEREVLQRSRAWTDEEWDAGVEGLRSSGLLDDGGGLTEAGHAVRDGVEARTDELAASTLAALGDDTDAVLTTLRTMSRDVIDRGDVGVPNPMGLQRP